MSAVTAAPPRTTWTGRLATVVIGIVGVVTFLADIVVVITVATGRYIFALGGADPEEPLSHLPQLLQAELREGTTGTLADADLLLRLLAALPSLVHAITAVAAAVVLIGIIQQVSRGLSFSIGVLARWTWLTIVLLAGGLLQSALDTVAVGYLMAGSHPMNENREEFLGGDYSAISIAGPQWPIPILLGGVIALALGIAFRSGARLEEEAEGVV